MSTDETRNEAVPRRRRWFRKRGIDLADLAVNSFAAFLGVFLALMVQNWSNTRQGQQKVEQARGAIQQELEANQKELTARVDYYKTFIRNAAEYGGPLTTRNNGCERIPGWNGFGATVLLHSAYDTAVATGVFAQMDFVESQRIATVYTFQSEFKEFSQRSLDYYIQTDMQRDNPCKSVFGDLSRFGDALNGMYRHYLHPSEASENTP